MQYFTTKDAGGVVVVKFYFDEITLEQRDEIRQNLALFLRDTDAKSFVLNLSKIGFLSSLVIATIIFFAREIRSNSGEVKLCELSRQAQDVVEITQLNKMFDIYSTESNAVNSFKK